MVDRLAEAEREITRYQQERERLINYTTDLQRIIEALCGNRKLPQPVSTARYHYNMAERALAEAKRENEALQKQVMMLGVQLDDMMFLSVEGFLDWQMEQRAARNAGGKNAE